MKFAITGTFANRGNDCHVYLRPAYWTRQCWHAFTRYFKICCASEPFKPVQTCSNVHISTEGWSIDPKGHVPYIRRSLRTTLSHRDFLRITATRKLGLAVNGVLSFPQPFLDMGYTGHAVKSSNCLIWHRFLVHLDIPDMKHLALCGV